MQDWLNKNTKRQIRTRRRKNKQICNSENVTSHKYATSRLKVPSKFWNVELEKAGEDQLDHSCAKMEKYYRANDDRNILHKIERRKDNWISQIVCRNYLLKHVIEGKI